MHILYHTLMGISTRGICPVPRCYVVAWLVDTIPDIDAYKYKGHTRVIGIDLIPHVDVYK
jgi:hypothetical protein